MRIQPIFVPDDSDTKKLYSLIMKDLELRKIPLGLAYLGNFPTLLDFIYTGSRDFLLAIGKEKLEQTLEKSQSLLAELLPTDNIKLNTNQKYLTPTIKAVAISQLRLVMWSVAVRENIKGFGWTTGYLKEKGEKSPTNHLEENDFSQEKLLQYLGEQIVADTFSLDKIEDSKILLPKFLQILGEFMQDFVKTDSHLYFRVALELEFQSILDEVNMGVKFSLPQLLQLTKKESNQQDFWYLVTDYVPALYMRELIASIIALRLL